MLQLESLNETLVNNMRTEIVKVSLIKYSERPWESTNINNLFELLRIIGGEEAVVAWDQFILTYGLIISDECNINGYTWGHRDRMREYTYAWPVPICGDFGGIRIIYPPDGKWIQANWTTLNTWHIVMGSLERMRSSVI